jgi:hypothetical protein
MPCLVCGGARPQLSSGSVVRLDDRVRVVVLRLHSYDRCTANRSTDILGGVAVALLFVASFGTEDSG